MMKTVILLHNHFDADHLEVVKAKMATLGVPTIRVIDCGDHFAAIEGSHRLRAAEETETSVNFDVLDENSEINLDTLDIDDNGWFEGERIVPVSDFIAWFTKSPFPADSATVCVEEA